MNAARLASHSQHQFTSGLTQVYTTFGTNQMTRETAQQLTQVAIESVISETVDFPMGRVLRQMMSGHA